MLAEKRRYGRILSILLIRQDPDTSLRNDSARKEKVRQCPFRIVVFCSSLQLLHRNWNNRKSGMRLETVNVVLGRRTVPFRKNDQDVPRFRFARHQVNCAAPVLQRQIIVEFAILDKAQCHH